jgi:hypothetical protein
MKMRVIIGIGIVVLIIIIVVPIVKACVVLPSALLNADMDSVRCAVCRRRIDAISFMVG